jgi:NADH dehydrogenase
VRASPLVEALGLPPGPQGRVAVERDLSVQGVDDVWAVGDVAAATDEDGEVLPQLAPVAVQAGKHVADQILARAWGEPTRPFRYVDKGNMATIGRRAAVAQLPMGLRLRGSAAWAAWLALHLVTLMGFRNRLSVFVNWTYSYLTWDRGARLILERGGVPHDASPPQTPL